MLQRYPITLILIGAIALGGGCARHRGFWARGEWEFRCGPHACQRAGGAQTAACVHRAPSPDSASQGDEMAGAQRCARRSNGQAGAAAEQPLAAGYRHPNLHPVPTCPVFSSRGPLTAVAETPSAALQQALPGDGSPKRIQLPMPPIPEELPRAVPQSETKGNQVTVTPRELPTTRSTESWLFGSSAPRLLDSASQTKPAGPDGWQLRR